MNYTKINGKQVSGIMLGTVQLGMNYGIANTGGQPDIALSHRMLSAAMDGGVTALDTAALYGTSEEVLGSFLATYPERDSVYVVSKLKVALPSDASEGDVEAAMFASVRRSLKRLGVDKLDCLLLHTAAEMTMYGDVVPNTLKKMIDMGYTAEVGVSVYTKDDVEEMLKHDIYRAIQIPASLFDQQLITGGYVKRLEEKGVAVYVRSVFLQGLFFLDPDTMTDPILVEYAKPYIVKLREMCKACGMSIAEFAISYIRDVHGVTALVLGADTDAQVRENIGYINASAIPENIRSEAERIFSHVNVEKIMEVLRRPKN